MRRFRIFSLVVSTVFTTPLAARAEVATWSPVSAVMQTRGLAAFDVDTVHARLVVFGGHDRQGALQYLNDLWALPLTPAAPEWQTLQAPGTGPSARTASSLTYDASRDRWIVFGGYYATAAGAQSWRNDVWTATLSPSVAWTHWDNAGVAPGARSQMATMIDPSRDRLLVFGGSSGTAVLGDLYALSLTLTDSARWSLPVVADSPAPVPRFGAARAYDAARNSYVVAGGLDADGQPLDDIWELVLGDTLVWRAVPQSETRPAARTNATLTAIAGDNRFVLQCGSTGNEGGTMFNDAWQLAVGDSAVWTPLAPAGDPPAARCQAVAAYDASSARLVLSCGSIGSSTLNDIVALTTGDAPAWGSLAPTRFDITARSWPASGFDPVRRHFLVFGGSYALNGALQQLNDVWSYDAAGSGGWTKLAPLGTGPGLRSGSAGVYDPVRDRFLIFGGYANPNKWLNELWSIEFASGTPTWVQITPGTSLPSPRSLATAAYDSQRDRLLIFGGSSGSTVFSDVWACALGLPPAWSKIAIQGLVPVPRAAATGLYDRLRDRLIIFGGFNTSSSQSDLLALDLSVSPSPWADITPPGASPAARSAAAAVYDAQRDRLLVFGGVSGRASGTSFNDTWTLPLATPGTPWSPTTAEGTVPSARYACAAAWDSTGDRLVVAGGTVLLDGTPTDMRDTWWLHFAQEVAVPERAPHPRLTLGAVERTASGLEWRGVAPSAGRIDLALFDVRGRAVARQSIVVGSGPFVSRVALPGRLAHGLFFAFCRRGAESATRRIVLP